MRTTAIVLLLMVAVGGMLPLDKIKGIIPDLTNIVTPAPAEGTTIPETLDAINEGMGVNWEKMEAVARAGAYKNRQEAQDALNSKLQEVADSGLSKIKSEVKTATEGNDWQVNLANLYARYARESAKKK